MPDKYDPYRDALVVEERTIWSEVSTDLSDERRRELERKLHADAAACGHLEYVRLHTGFCRQITVTPEDLARLSATS